MKAVAVISTLISLASLTSCFTGIESTPRITERTVHRHGADSPAADTDSLDVTLLAPTPLSQWGQGKPFYVTDQRATMLFGTLPPGITISRGDTLRYRSFSPATNIAGAPVTDITFSASGIDVPLVYRINTPPDTLLARQQLSIPFTIDLDMVDRAAATLTGKTRYIMTPRWLDADGTPLATQSKMVPVRIVGVIAGNDTHPLRVLFVPTGDDVVRSVWIGRGTQAPSHIFADTDPWLRYADITPEVRTLITRGDVRIGMTRRECRLALGQPDDIERGYGYSTVNERWTYAGGRILTFTDDLLTKIN